MADLFVFIHVGRSVITYGYLGTYRFVRAIPKAIWKAGSRPLDYASQLLVLGANEEVDNTTTLCLAGPAG